MKRVPARLWLLPARDVPVVAIVRRQPHRWWHTLRWDTETDDILPGAWHKGLFFPERSDISFDGRFMTCLLGYGRGVRTVPDLAPSLWWDDPGTYVHAGEFLDERRVGVDLRHVDEPPVGDPEWQVVAMEHNVMHARLLRDGWQWREGRWFCQPTSEHPVLQAVEVGRDGKSSYGYRFRLPGLPDLDWAWYDAKGHLVAARKGVVERFSLDDWRSKRAGFRLDLNVSHPPTSPTI